MNQQSIRTRCASTFVYACAGTIACAATTAAPVIIDRSHFDDFPHESLDFSLDGQGVPVAPPGGGFEMLIEYAPIGLRFDNSSFFTMDWVMTADSPIITGAIANEISDPVFVETFGLTNIHFDAFPIRSFGITIIIEGPIDSLFLNTCSTTFPIDESFIIASEEINGVTYNTLFLGFASDLPCASVLFGIPAGGTFYMDDLVYSALSQACAADLDGDGVVNSADLANLLASWNSMGPNAADLDGDGIVNSADLAQLLALWGPCR